MNQETISHIDHAANEVLLNVLNDRNCNNIALTVMHLHGLGFYADLDMLGCARKIVEIVWGWIDFDGIGESDTVSDYPSEVMERSARLLVDAGALDFD